MEVLFNHPKRVSKKNLFKLINKPEDLQQIQPFDADSYYKVTCKQFFAPTHISAYLLKRPDATKQDLIHHLASKHKTGTQEEKYAAAKKELDSVHISPYRLITKRSVSNLAEQYGFNHPGKRAFLPERLVHLFNLDIKDLFDASKRETPSEMYASFLLSLPDRTIQQSLVENSLGIVYFALSQYYKKHGINDTDKTIQLKENPSFPFASLAHIPSRSRKSMLSNSSISYHTTAVFNPYHFTKFEAYSAGANFFLDKATKPSTKKMKVPITRHVVAHILEKHYNDLKRVLEEYPMALEQKEVLNRTPLLLPTITAHKLIERFKTNVVFEKDGKILPPTLFEQNLMIMYLLTHDVYRGGLLTNDPAYIKRIGDRPELFIYDYAKPSINITPQAR